MAKNDAKWEALLRQAMEAARYAALEQYEKLVAAGPAYDVRNADLITGAAYGPSLGTMLDLCGFAGVKIRPANSSFVRYLRSQGVGRNDSYEGGTGFRLRLTGRKSASTRLGLLPLPKSSGPLVSTLGWTLGLTDSQSSPKRQARNQPRFSLIGGG